MRLVLLVALLFPAMAWADEGVVIQIVGYALVATGNVWGYALIVGGAVYSADKAKRKLKRNQDEARAARNAAMQDRMATIISEEAPHVYVYGRARVGSAIVAMFTSGARDEFKHLVCIHAAHECDAIEEVFVAGKSLGALDANGDVLGGDYYTLKTTSVKKEAHVGAAFTLAHVPVPGTLRVTYDDGGGGFPALQPVLTLVGADVTVAVSRSYLCHYEYQDNISRCRVKTHLGAPGDVADASLLAEVPGKWASTAVLRGYCYTVVRLDLNQAEFQGGAPAVEVVMRGKKLYDPRDASTTWKQNNALVVRDYLTSPMCKVAAADIPDGYLIAAANVCDELNSHSLPRYTCNGVVFATQSQPDVLEMLAQSMAGSITSTTWEIVAGKYTAPVLAFEQSDIIGNLAVTPGQSDADVSNGVKGRFFSGENDYVMTDYKPYQDAVYRAADGRDLYENIDLPFTDTLQAAHDLARIETEDARNGYTIKGEYSMKAWGVKVGDRVTQTSAVFGWTNKVFRVLDRKFSAMKGVALLLKEDTASIWDEAPAVTVDATPNTGLPNPFVVGIPGNVQMAEALYETTGSAGVKAKATLSWDEPLGYPSDYEIEYKRKTSGDWVEIPNIKGVSYEFLDIAPGDYDFRVKARNALGAVSQYTDVKSFTVYGLIAPPADFTYLNIAKVGGVALGSWNLSPDLDVRIGGRVVIRHSSLTSGATWADGYVLDEFNGDSVSGILPLVTGTYMIKARDSRESGSNYSANMLAFVATEGMLTGFTTVGTSTQASGFTGAKTDVSVAGGLLSLTDPATSLTGSYAFDTYMDLAAVATRRIEADISAFQYDDTLNVDSITGLIDTWGLIDGGAVNDCDVTLYASTTNDDPAGAPIWGPWTQFVVADFTCRALKFKLDFVSGNVGHNISVNTLTVHAKV